MADAPERQRVLLKISGEMLSGKGQFGFSETAISYLVGEIASVVPLCELAIVLGGGNWFRGSRHKKFDKVVADQIGMTMTIANGLALRDMLERACIPSTERDAQPAKFVSCRLMSAVEIKTFAEPYIRQRAVRHLEKGRVVILVGGTGNPRATTDSAMVLRACEIGAYLVLKGTKEDYIYDRDPREHTDATSIRRISHADFVQKNLGILDVPAVASARENGISIRVFNIFQPGNLNRIVCGEDIGSLICS